MSKTRLKNKKTQAFLYALSDFLYKHTIPVLLLFLALTVYFGNLATRLQQKTTVRDLLPAHNQVVKNFEETVESFDLIDRVLVVLQFDPKDYDTAIIFAETFEEQISSNPQSDQFLHWMKAYVFDRSEAGEWFRYLRFLFRLLPTEDMPALLEQVSPAGIENQIAQNRRDLESGLGAKELVAQDPLNLLKFAGTYMNEIAGNYKLAFGDGFLVNKEKNMLLIPGKPKSSPEDVDFSVGLTNFLEEQIQITRQQLIDDEEIDTKDVLNIGLTGPHPITAHENLTIKKDMVNMFVTSFLFVLLLFAIAYRRPLAILYVGVPLLCAEIWTLGIGYLLFGRLNLLTATFSAVIVGLGIDYAIHIFSRYLDERAQGRDVRSSMQCAIAETGMGTMVGGATTAGAFLAMGSGNFSGLREFASIAAVGILLCLVQMFILLPCMLFLRERLRGEKKANPRPQWDFHVESLLAVCLRHRGITLAILMLASAFLAWHAINLRFSSDLRSVRAKSNPGLELQGQVTEKVGGSLRSLTFVLSADNETELYAIQERMLPVLHDLEKKGDLVRFDNLMSVLHSPQAQQENIALIEESGLTGESVKTAFVQVMAKHQMRMTDDIGKYIDNLAQSLDARETITLEQVYHSEGRFLRPFLNIENGRYRTVVHVYPSKGLWEKDATRALTQSILDAIRDNHGDNSDVFVTGLQTISDELKSKVKESFEVSTIIAVLFVFGLLYLHFRKFSLVALTLVPLLVSVVWMLGIMELAGIDITILNFVATPLIIGIGIDDGVHIVEKYLHRDTGELTKLIASCGKAVTLTSLTTIFGFMSLFMAEYSGFHSLGLCAILGVFCCWLGSVIILPLLMDRFKVKFIRETAISKTVEDA